MLGFGKDSIQFAAPPEKLALDTVIVDKDRRQVARVIRNRSSGAQSEFSIELPSNRKIRLFYARIITSIPAEGKFHTSEPIVKCRGDNARLRIQAPAGTPVAVLQLGELLSRDRLPRTKHASASGWTRKSQGLSEEARTVEAKLQNNAFVERAPETRSVDRQSEHQAS